MSVHWLDSDVFIQSKNGPYGFDIAPGFWRLIEGAANEGSVRSPMEVYNELAAGSDQLAEWAKDQTSLFVDADDDVQLCFQVVADHVEEAYEEAFAAEFLGSADPWLIAHAINNLDVVVTREARLAVNAKRVKIPNRSGPQK